MVDGIPQTNGGGVNPAHSKVLDNLRAKIDGNRNGLKGSEIINFVNFAKAEGVSDADINAYMQQNGLAIIKDSDENHKVDIKEFKAEEKFKSSRKTKNEILDLRQRYMNVALDAFKNADSPEKKAQIMDLVQKMPRTDESYSNFRTRIEGWETKLGLIIGFDNVQKSLDTVSEKMDAQHAEEMKNMDDNTTYIVNATRQAIELSEGRINKHTDEVGEGVKQHVTKERKTAVRQVGAKIDDAVSDIKEHVTNEHNTTRAANTARTQDIKEHVTKEHEKTRKEIKTEIDNSANDTQRLNSARAELTEILEGSNDMYFNMGLNIGDVRALGTEARHIADSFGLTTKQKVQLLESMAQHINDQLMYISDVDLAKIYKARKMMLNGEKLPTKDVVLNGGRTYSNYFIDYDKIELK